MVSVSLVLRNGIIEKANLAATEYQKSAEEESTELDKLEDEINKYNPKEPINDKKSEIAGLWIKYWKNIYGDQPDYNKADEAYNELEDAGYGWGEISNLKTWFDLKNKMVCIYFNYANKNESFLLANTKIENIDNLKSEGQIPRLIQPDLEYISNEKNYEDRIVEALQIEQDLIGNLANKTENEMKDIINNGELQEYISVNLESVEMITYGSSEEPLGDTLVINGIGPYLLNTHYGEWQLNAFPH